MSVKDEITERVGVHKFALTILQDFNWLEREQPISDHGIDFQIEIVDDGHPTGMLYAVQLKSGRSYFNKSTKDAIVFRGQKKHLSYWTDYSLPVILVLYNPEEDNLYWAFVNKANTLETANAWKIEIPKSNILTRESKQEIEKYYINTNDFTLLKTEDTSHALSRRISVKLLLKKNISNYVIKNTIPHFIEKLKNSDYFRNEIVYESHKNKLADSIWVYTYKTLEQFHRGLPHCIAVWNDPESESPTKLSNHDECIDNSIQIKWGNDIIPDALTENCEMSKGQYLKIIDKFLIEARNEIQRIEELFLKHREISIEAMKVEIIRNDEYFNNLLPIDYINSYPPNECSDLDQEIQNIRASIDNIYIVIKDKKRDCNNITKCIGMYLKICKENLEASKYERRKVI
ncbi:DUF4365 domain-containing protein [Halomonas sp. SpR1]|uniref:DUF4365 domain-containing protein n=1 Tax=Halomonas sp. SpR1 TaxID=3050462 RepID=UPI0027E4E0C4|nr:DUF4365 domain-containing protein [Halomonas sp. SpR1]MDQ7731713.1 DUF4365 domain-containing protein [Halomonas sp. SpR1]